MMKHPFFIMLLFILGSGHISGHPVDSVYSCFQEQLHLFPQEKVYLQTDKSCYAGGERIWLRAYMLNAATHVPHLMSGHLYVELINPNDSIVSRVKLLPIDYAFYGNLPVPREIKAGEYRMRAYTNYMRNVGEDYFFMKKIQVEELSLNADNKTVVEPDTDYDVSFFPEGGELPAGTFCHVGIKALNNKGTSEEVKGRILNEEGDTITSFRTIFAGLGVVGVALEAGKKYVAECEDSNGRTKRFPFPEPLPGLCNLQTRWTHDKLMISLVKSEDMQTFPEDYSVLIQCRGIVLYAQPWEKGKEYLAIEKRALPSGVLHVVLINKEMKPISERLMYCKNDDQAHIVLKTDKETYDSRSHIKASSVVTDPDGKPLSGSFSVSVTDNRDVKPDTTLSIFSSILLASDLRGYIESPEFYLQNNQLSARALDCLLLTQGWRRYDVSHILSREYDKPNELLERGQYLSGKVCYARSKKPAKNMEISVMVAGTSFIRVTTTDKEGRFKVEGFEYPDSTEYILTTTTPLKDEGIIFVMDSSKIPDVQIPWNGIKSADMKNDQYREKAYLRRFHDPNIWTIDLDEVVIKGKLMEKKKIVPLHQEMSRKKVSLEMIERFKPSTMQSLVGLLQGVTITSSPEYGEVIYLNALGRQYAAKILIDGFEGSLQELNVNDVEQVDVIYPPQSGMFGLESTGGVVAFSTKTGGGGADNRIANLTYYKPLGFQSPVEFYSPAYKTASQKKGDIPDMRTTIYWNPNVSFSENGKASFDFYSADAETDYSIIVEGTTYDGRLIYSKKDISVSKQGNIR